MNRLLAKLGIAAAAAAVLLVPAPASASITGIPLHNPNPLAAPLAPQAGSAPTSAFQGLGPITGASWAGLSDSQVSPPDPNGAIGPNSYFEIINEDAGIYSRTGSPISTGTMATLTGDGGPLSDPMVLWDANTQRFYYNVWSVGVAPGGTNDMDWGFSKTSNPTSLSSSFCNYRTSFGYSSSEVPDYPKLGQSEGFLMIGVNHYPNASANRADRSDLLWIDKPQGSGPITTCPPASSFMHGIFKNLRNQDGTQAWTPVPAIQDDATTTGYVVTSSDIECPPTCGTGTKITVHLLTPSPANPKIAVFTTTGKSVTVAPFTPPKVAPQKGTSNTLSTLDGRLEHAVAAIDPAINKEVVWTGHTVNGPGNRSEFVWYEILPSATPTQVSTGTLSSPTLFVFNGAVAPDRTVNPTGAAHGNTIIIGFSTSSSSTLPAVQMVEKIGTGAVSPFVVVHQATSPDTDFTCTAPFGPPCRWGDYGGATSDPAQSLTAAHGEVWLSNDTVTSGLNTTWNWEAKP